MKRKIAMVLVAMMSLGILNGCGSESAKSGSESEASATDGIFSGQLEENVTIQVLENDTAISKG